MGKGKLFLAQIKPDGTTGPWTPAGEVTEFNIEMRGGPSLVADQRYLGLVQGMIKMLSGHTLEARTTMAEVRFIPDGLTKPTL